MRCITCGYPERERDLYECAECAEQTRKRLRRRLFLDIEKTHANYLQVSSISLSASLADEVRRIRELGPAGQKNLPKLARESR